MNLSFRSPYGNAFEMDPEEERKRLEWFQGGNHCWKGNEHWMRRYGEPEPTHDPPSYGCESCHWLDEEGDVTTSDLIWVTGAAWWPEGRGGWLCMECD